MVWGGIVVMTWMSAALVSDSFCGAQSWWLIISTMLACVSSLAAIRVQWMAFRVVLWSVGNASPTCDQSHGAFYYNAPRFFSIFSDKFMMNNPM